MPQDILAKSPKGTTGSDWLARKVAAQRAASVTTKPSIFEVERQRRLGIEVEETKPAEVRVTEVKPAPAALTEAERQATAEWEAQYVKLDTGEWVSRDEFNKLNETQQKDLKTTGIDKFNMQQGELYKTLSTEYQKQQAEIQRIEQIKSLEQQILDSQTRIADWRNILKTPGISQSYKTHAQMEIASLEQKVYVLQESKATLSKAGYTEIDSDWQKIINESGVEGLNQYVRDNYPGAIGLTKATDPSTGKLIEFGTTDNPNIVIEKGGNRIYIGDRWPESAKRYMTKMPEGIESKMWPVEVSTALTKPIEVVRTETGIITRWPDEVKKYMIPEVEVKLQQQKATNEYEFMAKLNKDIQDTFNAEIEAIKIEIDRKKAIIASKISKIESEKIAEAGKSFTERIKNILNKPTTAEDLAKEVLSLGLVETKAFDDKELELEYLKEQQKFLDEDTDIGISLEDYKDKIYSQQSTLKELGMQFMPFEYARPERWKTLQTWEKIVWPALDIAMLIPVVGWVAKGAGVGVKVASTGAKIAAAGGKQALKFAATDAIKSVETGAAKVAAREVIFNTVKTDLESSAKGISKNILKNAATAAEKDLALAQKELSQITKQAKTLQELAIAAEKAPEITKGTKAFQATQRIEQAISGQRGVGKAAVQIGTHGTTAVIGGTTVVNWEDLNSMQKVAALGMAALNMGIPGKVRNIVENVTDPYKVPISVLKGRKLPSTMKPGELFQAEGGTARLVMSEAVTPEAARQTVAELSRQIASGLPEARAIYGTKEIIMKGPGLQEIVAKGGVVTGSATPMGNIFKKGTGASGIKTNLEQYLEQLEKQGIKYEIPGVVTTPGVTVIAKEGGEYFGPELYYKFAFQAAFGGKGKMPVGILLHAPEISKLPRAIANKEIGKMEKAAIKTFNGSRYLNEEVEGFKQYAKFMEFEDVVTNGSQEFRTQNLRSKLADKLHFNRGEYYTRTPEGRIELLQMYLEGGRAIPYSLKELYQLKGKALKNSLEDLFFGTGEKIKELKAGKSTGYENILTKEEALSSAFDAIDKDVSLRKISTKEAMATKKEIYDKLRQASRSEYDIPRLRRDIDNQAQRISKKVLKTYAFESERARVDIPRIEIPRGRIPTVTDYTIRPPRIEERILPRIDIDRLARASRERVERTTRAERARVLRAEEVRRIEPRPERITEARREEIRREIPRERVSRERPPREEITRRGTPREEIPRERIPRERIPREVTTKRTTTELITGRASSFEELTKEQRLASVAWRQGKWYHLIYPPYSKTNVLHSTDPFSGVTVVTGIGSAKKSLSRVRGEELPQKILWDLGIVDIEFTKGKEGIVGMKYIPDPHDRSKVRKPIGMPQTRIKSRKGTNIISSIR